MRYGAKGYREVKARTLKGKKGSGVIPDAAIIAKGACANCRTKNLAGLDIEVSRIPARLIIPANNL